MLCTGTRTVPSTAATPVNLRNELVPIVVAMACLGRREDEILNQIEIGLIRWAFDVRNHGAARREIRIWRECLRPRNPSADAEPSLDAVLDRILPAASEISGTRVCRILTCSSTHVVSLFHARELRGIAPSRGINGSAKILTASLRAFLRKRLVV